MQTPQNQQANLLVPQTSASQPTPSPPQAALTQVPQTPQTYLTFLLISGKRRTMAFDPETAIGRVKELVWNSWPADWQDDRPPAPSYLRVLYLGRMLQDDEVLSRLKLPTYTPPSIVSQPSTPGSGPVPTIMHLSIRPYAPPQESEGVFKKKKRRGGDGASYPYIKNLQWAFVDHAATDGSPNNNDGSPTSGAGGAQGAGGRANEAGYCRCVIC
ncbi:hypothetical protein CPC08DRAFT_780203 [Agrocybe pediades]|nr:hypothetical protein CPC08DRAFT_780203 [Agrocybe pediades]